MSPYDVPAHWAQPAPEPDRMEYPLGPDKYGRTTKAIGERETNGCWTWTIKSEPCSQRDEGEIIRSLTTPQLLTLHAIGKFHRR
jgi:hypothetical protein